MLWAVEGIINDMLFTSVLNTQCLTAFYAAKCLEQTHVFRGKNSTIIALFLPNSLAIFVNVAKSFG